MNYAKMMNDVYPGTYQSSSLIVYFGSNFWASIVNKIIQRLKNENAWNDIATENQLFPDHIKADKANNIISIRNEIDNLLGNEDFNTLQFMEDELSETKELELLKLFEFRVTHVLIKRWFREYKFSLPQNIYEKIMFDQKYKEIFTKKITDFKVPFFSTRSKVNSLFKDYINNF